MPIAADSRYITATITTEVGPDLETRQEMRVAFPRSRLIAYTFYRVVEGERVDTIAKDFYGKGELWWMIADANPEIIDWFDIMPGTIIRVPNA
jgi:phage tail protein X